MRLRPLLAAMLLGLASPAYAASPFAGVWAGTWSDEGLQQSGRATLSIDARGNAHGTVTNTTAGLDSPLDGHVDDDGATALAYRYRQGAVQLSYRATGLLQLSGSRLTGLLIFTFETGGVLGHGTFTLDRARGPAPPIAGPAAGLVNAGAAATDTLERRP